MIDINLVRTSPDKVRLGVELKGYDASLIDKVLVLDKNYRKLLLEVESLRAAKNKSAKEKNIEEGKKIKSALQSIEPKLNDTEKKLFSLLNEIPNLPEDTAPKGKGENDNVEIKKWGDIPSFDFEPRSHLDIGEKLGIIDFDNGAKVSGSQFYFLSGDAVLLELALLQYGIEFLFDKGYRPYITPDLAKSRYYLGTGYQPKGDEAQIYEIEGEDLGLIATAEVTMAGLHADEVIDKAKLPLKYAAISHCFRKEAGAYGKYSKGLYRVHQFTKLEMFVYTTPEKSDEAHNELLSIEEEMIQSLGIPYRVLEMCTGDLGAIASKKYDLEAWMPGRGDYGEITSTSNTTDYQARNLNIKYKDGNKNEYLHMLNGTALVMSRIPVAILENFQQKDGSVVVPEVLRKWMGKDVIK
ncbi:serine--tRNA ligase [Candidatus Microgenomates bacterium]|nr:MAG: serine--tRNA ligase [Candidatus Microgenomates bacterium]